MSPDCQKSSANDSSRVVWTREAVAPSVAPPAAPPLDAGYGGHKRATTSGEMRRDGRKQFGNDGYPTSGKLFFTTGFPYASNAPGELRSAPQPHMLRPHASGAITRRAKHAEMAHTEPGRAARPMICTKTYARQLSESVLTSTAPPATPIMIESLACIVK